MNWNLFWGIYVLAFAVACLIVAYALGYKSIKKGEKCSAKTHGTVVGYSSSRHNGVSLPVVEYTVDGKDYAVIGPRFKSAVVKNVSTPWNKIVAEQESNIKTSGALPDVIKVSRKANSFVSVRTSPLAERYPIGSSVDVYYDPQKPKRSYVERYVSPHLFFCLWLPLIFGILLTALGIYLLFGPELVMQSSLTPNAPTTGS